MPTNFAYDYGYEFNYETSNAAPQLKPRKKPEPKNAPDLKKLKKQQADMKIQQRAAAKTVLKFAPLVVLAAVSLSILCGSFAMLREQRLEYSRNMSNLEIYKSQQVEVNAKLEMLVTPDKLTKIAVEKLGMVKLPEENKAYAVSNKENEVVISK